MVMRLNSKCGWLKLNSHVLYANIPVQKWEAYQTCRQDKWRPRSANWETKGRERDLLAAVWKGVRRAFISGWKSSKALSDWVVSMVILTEQVAMCFLHTWGQPLHPRLAKEDAKAKKSLESSARALPTAKPINNQCNRWPDLNNEGRLL